MRSDEAPHVTDGGGVQLTSDGVTRPRIVAAQVPRMIRQMPALKADLHSIQVDFEEMSIENDLNGRWYLGSNIVTSSGSLQDTFLYLLVSNSAPIVRAQDKGARIFGVGCCVAVRLLNFFDGIGKYRHTPIKSLGQFIEEVSRMIRQMPALGSAAY